MIRPALGVLCLAASLTHAAAQPAAPSPAQTWPSQRVRMIVPYSAGGTTDYLGRLAAEAISRKTGQQVVVENRTGAGGNIGSAAVAKSAPDGLTLGMLVNSSITVNQYLYTNMGYDPLADLVVAAVLGEAPQVVVVNKDLPARTLQEFVALAKAKPNSLNYATAGAGSTNHLSVLLLSRLAGIQMTHVPYRGAAPAVADLTSGVVQMFPVGVAPVAGLVEAGELRLLAAATRQRLPQLPNLPTAAEGGVPGYESTSWFGVVAPTGTPREIVDTINAMMRELVAQPETLKKFDQAYLIPWSYTPDELRKIVVEEAAVWEKVVKDAGLKLE
ncbi:MAG: extra-cytoplasmic solute receptor protein [Hyphomicrobiales bacterium]|nr:extra-cytoplasmic solute receptor protein [Hyphomicrobiales bacterium]